MILCRILRHWVVITGLKSELVTQQARTGQALCQQPDHGTVACRDPLEVFAFHL